MFLFFHYSFFHDIFDILNLQIISDCFIIEIKFAKFPKPIS